MKRAGISSEQIAHYERAGNGCPLNACFDFSAKFDKHLERVMHPLDSILPPAGGAHLHRRAQHRVVPHRCFGALAASPATRANEGDGPREGLEGAALDVGGLEGKATDTLAASLSVDELYWVSCMTQHTLTERYLEFSLEGD